MYGGWIRRVEVRIDALEKRMADIERPASTPKQECDHIYAAKAGSDAGSGICVYCGEKEPTQETGTAPNGGMKLTCEKCGHEPCAEWCGGSTGQKPEPDLGFGIAILRSMVRAHMRDGLPQDAALAKVIEYGELRSEAIAALRASLNRGPDHD